MKTMKILELIEIWADETRAPNGMNIPIESVREVSRYFKAKLTELEQQLSDQEEGIDNAVKAIIKQGEIIDEADKLLDECEKYMSHFFGDHNKMLTKLRERNK